MALSCEEETVVQFRTRNEQFCELVQGWSGYRVESRPTGLPVALRSACRTIWPNRHSNFGKLSYAGVILCRAAHCPTSLSYFSLASGHCSTWSSPRMSLATAFSASVVRLH